MKYIISINHKFFKVNPVDLYNLIKKDVDGVEIYFDYKNKIEVDYVKKFISIVDNFFIINMHGNGEEQLSIQIDYIHFCSTFNRDINIVIHPKIDINKNNSILRTNNYISVLQKMIIREMLPIKLSIENLNNIGLVKRLHKEDVEKVLKENKYLFFTYDIGHELIDKIEILNLTDYLLEHLNNIHIHTFNGIIDHMPINEITDDINKIINYLIKIKYDKTIVFEYDLNRINGDNVINKINNYLISINIFKNKVIECSMK